VGENATQKTSLAGLPTWSSSEAGPRRPHRLSPLKVDSDLPHAFPFSVSCADSDFGDLTIHLGDVF
jgi:hypothetical protein